MEDAGKKSKAQVRIGNRFNPDMIPNVHVRRCRQNIRRVAKLTVL